MAQQGYSAPASRNTASADGIKSKVSVGQPGNNAVSGKVASKAPVTGNGAKEGSGVKGHAGTALKGGFVKV